MATANSKPHFKRPKLNEAALLDALLKYGITETVATVAVAAVKKAQRPGRPEPETATGKMHGARRARARAYAARNELIGTLAQFWPARVMPVTANLRSLNRDSVVCIDSPAGQLAWIITKVEADEQFATIPKVKVSDWDGSTAADRSARLAKLTIPTATPKKGRAKR